MPVLPDMSPFVGTWEDYLPVQVSEILLRRHYSRFNPGVTSHRVVRYDAVGDHGRCLLLNSAGALYLIPLYDGWDWIWHRDMPDVLLPVDRWAEYATVPSGCGGCEEPLALNVQTYSARAWVLQAGDRSVTCAECDANSRACIHCGRRTPLSEAEYASSDSDGERPYCGDCAASDLVACGSCEDVERMHDMYYVRWLDEYYCGPCFDMRFFVCPDCGITCNDDDGYEVEDRHGNARVVCVECNENAANFARLSERAVVTGEAVGMSLGFGVEVEVEWDGGEALPTHGGYHSDYPAEPPFFPGWRAESDSSLTHGVEFISPVLSGAKGVAEVLATLDLLDGMEARVSVRCGQHIHVSADSDQLRDWRVQAVVACLEDFLIASTGSFRRFTQGVGRVKGHNLPDSVQFLVERGSDVLTGGRCTASITDNETVEYRHPPGTLNGTQFLINLGLVLLASDMACTLDDDTLRGMAVGAAMWSHPLHDAYMRGASIPRSSRAPWYHGSILNGSRIVASHGWYLGGTWSGMPYNLRREGGTRMVVQGDDNSRREVRLPTEVDVVTRLRRQLTRFYMRAATDRGAWWTYDEGQRMADEVLAVFETPERVPLTATGA